MKQTHEATQHRARSFQLRFCDAALDAQSGIMLRGLGGTGCSGGLFTFGCSSTLTRRVGEPSEEECFDITGDLAVS